MADALLDEIVASVNYMLEQNEISEHVGANIRMKIRNNKIHKITTNNLPIPFVASYDMGWRKRAGGRVYDTLSGHGVLLGIVWDM